MGFHERQRPEVSLTDQRIAEAVQFNMRYGISDALGLSRPAEIRTTQLHIAKMISQRVTAEMQRLMRNPAIVTPHSVAVIKTSDVPKSLAAETQVREELEELLRDQRDDYPDRSRIVRIGEAVRNVLSEADKRHFRLKTRRLY